jgi:hypothetical protein
MIRTRRPASVVVALILALTTASAVAAAPAGAQVILRDNCDPATFNAVLGEGACARPGGGLTFEAFIGQLMTLGRAPSWHFTPYVRLADGGTVTAVNRGGEAHTFTEVAAFGGGCVDELNEILGLEPVPECQDLGAVFATIVFPGNSLTTEPLDSGTHRFQCAIHPWQRTVVDVD